MSAEKGNSYAKGNKGGGRKSKAEEFKAVKDKIRKQTIEELAKTKVYKCLESIEPVNDKQGVKDIAMPVYLKSKADKIDLTTVLLTDKDKDKAKNILNDYLNDNTRNTKREE